MHPHTPGLSLCLFLLPAVSLGDSSNSYAPGSGSSPGFYAASAPTPGGYGTYPAAPSTPDAPPSTYGIPEHDIPTKIYPSATPDSDLPYPFSDTRFQQAGYKGGPPRPFFPFDDPSLLALPPPFGKVSVLHNHLYTIIEPVFVAVVGIIVFLVVKNIVLPHLGHFYRTLEDNYEDEEERRTFTRDSLTATVMKALARGACLQRMACQAGLSAKNYTLTNSVIRAIDASEGPPEVLAAIFRDAATGHLQSCEPYVCKNANRRQTKPPVPPQ